MQSVFRHSLDPLDPLLSPGSPVLDVPPVVEVPCVVAESEVSGEVSESDAEPPVPGPGAESPDSLSEPDPVPPASLCPTGSESGSHPVSASKGIKIKESCLIAGWCRPPIQCIEENDVPSRWGRRCL